MASAESTGAPKLIKMTLKRDGKDYSFMISQELAAMLQSPDCDEAVKQSVIEAVTAGDSSACSTNEPKCSTSSESSATSSLQSQACHTWSEAEERSLINIRLSRDEDFNRHKTHDVLWLEITKELNSLGSNVSLKQVKDKWANLKKRYKEVVDENNKTGSDRKDWKYLEIFNKHFGHKAGTTASCTYDSGHIKKKFKLNDICSEDSELSPEMGDTDKLPETVRKGNKKGKMEMKGRKKRASLVEIVEKHTEDMKEQLVQMHKDKMQRFDRFLDILESKEKTKDS